MFPFRLKESFPGPPSEVLRRSTLSFDDFVKHMPNVTRVEELSRKRLSPDVEEICVRVHAEGMIPAVARPFMSKEMNWRETYTVNHADFTADWRVETPVFTEYVHCSGTSRVVVAGTGSELLLEGTMHIDTPPDMGIGKALAGQIIKVIEPFIGRMVIANLKKYFHSLKKDMSTARPKGRDEVEKESD